MNQLAELPAWCAVQVTLFSAVALGVYSVVYRLRIGGATTVLVVSLAAVTALTLMSFSPWPRWISLKSREPRRAVVELRPAEVDARTDQVDVATVSSNELSPSTRSADGDASVETIAKQFTNPLPVPHRDWERGASVVSQDIAQTAPAQVTPQLVFGAAAACAALVGLLRLIASSIRLWDYHRTSVTVNDGPLHDLLSTLSRQLNLPRPVQVRESPSLGVAATAGWRRPYILLPASWRTWTSDEQRAVLAHELVHIKQRHFPAWMLSQLPLVAHYYHPLVHGLARRLRFEQEVAADQLAAQLFGERRHYAMILAGLALGAAPRRSLFTTLGLFMSRPLLMRRIAMLRQTAQTSSRTSRKSRVILLLVLSLAALAVSGLRTSRAENDSEPVAPESSSAEVASEPVALAETEPASSEAASATTGTGSPGPASNGVITAVALFEVTRTTPSVAGTESNIGSEANWEVHCKTQLAKLKSYYLLHAALRRPGIDSLPLVKSQPEPLGWLAKSLDVGFIPGSEMMQLRLHGKSGEDEQLTQLVNAVAKAYEEEVIFDEKSRQLNIRDVLARSLQALEKEIEEGMALYLSMAKEQGKAESGHGRIAQEIDLKRLDRIDAELMRLEDEFLSAKIYHEQAKGEVSPGEKAKLQFYEQRIRLLQKRQEELGERILDRDEQSVDLAMLKSKLDRDQQVARELGLKLTMMEIEAAAPPRIRLVQQAVVTRAQAAQDGGDRTP